MSINVEFLFLQVKRTLFHCSMFYVSPCDTLGCRSDIFIISVSITIQESTKEKHETSY